MPPPTSVSSAPNSHLPINLQTYPSLRSTLLELPAPVLLSPSPSAPSPTLSDAISSLHVHPSLEAALHILNNDLPSAHFLVRHMQSPPRYEAMLLHAILHCIEGDLENARAWYRDVQGAEVFEEVWGAGMEGVEGFLRRVERVKKKEHRTGMQGVNEEEEEELRRESQREILAVIGFCEKNFGTGMVEDATQIWVQNENHANRGEEMVVGGEGWRQF